MEFLKTPRAFAMELAELNNDSAGKAMDTFLYYLKEKKQPGISAAWAAEVVVEIAKMREQGLIRA